jgi:hypothetical protein
MALRRALYDDLALDRRSFAKRSSMLCAIVAVARKPTGILHHMWIDGSDFKAGFGTKVTQRLKLKPTRKSGNANGAHAHGRTLPAVGAKRRQFAHDRKITR